MKETVCECVMVFSHALGVCVTLTSIVSVCVCVYVCVCVCVRARERESEREREREPILLGEPTHLAIFGRLCLFLVVRSEQAMMSPTTTVKGHRLPWRYNGGLCAQVLV